MPLPEEFYNRYRSNIYKEDTLGSSMFSYRIEDDEEEEDLSLPATLWEGLGKHFISSATMGGSELLGLGTTPWAEKTTGEKVGAAVGEAAGMFLPMGLMGHGIKGVMSTFGAQGSKYLAKNAIKQAADKVSTGAFKEAVETGLKKGVKEGDVFLHQHELGGEIARNANDNLMQGVAGAIRKQVKKQSGKDITDTELSDIMDVFQKGIDEGAHLNSMASWMRNKLGVQHGSPGFRSWLATYAGEVAQDIAILTTHGLMHHSMLAAAREDMPFAPGSTVWHSLGLSFLFPLVRAIPGGGERRMGEAWNILKSNYKKTDYDKLVKLKNGPENLRSLLQVMTGGPRSNIIKKSKWTSRISNKSYHIDEFNGIDLSIQKNIDDLVDVGKQIQQSVGKFDMLKLFGKDFLMDSVHPGTLFRYAAGSAVMNVDMFRDNMAAFRNLPAEELYTHMLIGAFMSRGRGGWAHNSASRSGDAKAVELNNHYKLMNLLGIDHSSVSDYLKVKDYKDLVMNLHIGIRSDSTVQEIEAVFKHYEGKITKRSIQSSGIAGDIIEEFSLLRNAAGMIEKGRDFQKFNYNYLSPKDRAKLVEALQKIKYKDKTLKETTYQELMDDVTVNQTDSIRSLYNKFFERLGRESSPGADDAILRNTIGRDGVIRHGGIEWESEHNSTGELHLLLTQLKRAGLAIEETSSLKPKVDLRNKDSAQSQRLERIMKEFKKEQTNIGLGEGTWMDIPNLGDPEQNPYLDNILNSHKFKSQKRVSDIVTGQISQANSKDANLRQMLLNDLTDPDTGRVIHPDKVVVVGDDGSPTTVKDGELQGKIRGLAKVLYAGHHSTSDAPKNSDVITISEKKASEILGQYEAMGIGIEASTLGDPSTLKYVRLQAFNKMNISPHSIQTLELLNEAGLIQVDLEKGKVLVNSDKGIENLALDPSIDGSFNATEVVKMYREILDTLPKHIIEVSQDVIRFPYEADKFVNIEALAKIHKTIPEVYNEIVKNDILNIIGNKKLLDFDEERAMEELTLLNGNLLAMNYNEALINVENLKRLIPELNNTLDPKEIVWDAVDESYRIKIFGKPIGKVRQEDINHSPANKKFANAKEEAKFEAEKIADEFLSKLPDKSKNQYDTLIDAISDARDNAKTLDLTIQEYADGTSIFTAIENMLKAEKTASNQVKEYLEYIVQKGTTYKWAAVNDHARLVDNLNALIGNAKQKISLEDLFDTYLNNQSFKSFHELTQALTQKYAGRTEVNLLDQKSLMGAYENFFQNHADTPTKTRLDIGKKYGLLDSLNPNSLESKAIELLKANDLIGLKKRISNELLKDDNIDQDLANLQFLVANTIERKTIKFTEKLIDGEVYLVREIISPQDNPLFNTPANQAIDKLNEMGIDLVTIQKSGIINGRWTADLGVDPEVKGMFEQQKNIINLPSDKYITDVIKKGGVLNHLDTIQRDLLIDPNGKFRFVDVSFSNPLAFIETPKSIDALNSAYDAFYNRMVRRYTRENKTDVLNNFKRLMDPTKVLSYEAKIAALYHSNLNMAAFDKLWTHEAVTNFNEAKGHNDLALKMIKYAKLAEGGSLKAIPDKFSLEKLITDLGADPNTTLRKGVIRSVERIVNDLKTTIEGGSGKGILYGFYADEAEGNPFMVRNNVIDQINNTIGNTVLRDHLRSRVSNTDRFKNTMDQSSIDGAIFIDRDIFNLMKLMLNSGKDVNGFKGSIARTSTDNLQYVLFGKGLFIFDPLIAKSMQKKGVRFLMGESAAKDKMGLALDSKEVTARIADSSDLVNDIQLLGDNNIVRGSLEGVGLRFGGHISAGAPVPHPYTHFMPENLVIGVREGWMQLQKNIDEIKGFSNFMKQKARHELGLVMTRQLEQYGPAFEQSMPNFAKDMLSLGFNTTNEVLNKAVKKVFENQTLPTLLKPRNPKFAYSFMTPDLRSSNPLSVDLYRVGATDRPRGAVRIQLGQATLGADSKYMPVHSANELVYSVRVKDVDYLVKYDSSKKGSERFEMYTAINDFTSAVDFQNRQKYTTDIQDSRGRQHRITTTNKMPKKVINFIEYLDMILSGKSKRKDMQTVINSQTGRPSLWGVQSIIEKFYTSKNYDLEKNGFSIILSGERGPRKGRGDFMPLKVRARTREERMSGDIGTTFGVNSYDARANAQADWDGDKMRFTHDFSKFKGNTSKWEFIKKAYREAAINEEYSVLESPLREVNPFQIATDNKGELTHAGDSPINGLAKHKSLVIQERMAVGKVIGSQSALEWMTLGGFRIGDREINKKLGFDIDNIMDYGDIYRRFDKASQSAVDFIKGINEQLVKDPYGYMLYGDGETELRSTHSDTLVFPFSETSLMREAVNMVIDVLRRPASIFNQVYSDAGGKAPTAYDLQSQYTTVKKFFKDPNYYIMRKLVNKYGQDNAKMNQIVDMFFGENYAKNIDEFKQRLNKGKLKPVINLIEFTASGDHMEILRKSNIGFLMDEVVQSDIYKVNEIDLAWKYKGDNIRDLRALKHGSENFIDEITMYRALGFDMQRLMDDGDVLLTVRKQKYLQNEEQAAIMHDILSHEKLFLQDKLDHQYGYKHTNKHTLNKTSNRLLAVDAALEYIEGFRTETILNSVKDKQNLYTVKFGKNKRKHFNNSNKQQVLYKITGDLVNVDGSANRDAIDFRNPIIVRPNSFAKVRGQVKDNFNGRYVKLDNPIIGHRISRNKAIEGYTWHYMHNNMPGFTEESIFQGYQDHAINVGRQLTDSWQKSIRAFKSSRGFAKDIFEQEYRNRTVLLDEYFKRIIAPNDVQVVDEHIVPGLDESSSLLYYKAKLLLKPKLLERHYVKGESADLPFFSSNDKLFENTFSWLLERGHKDVAKELSREYNGIKDYLSGMNNEMTFKLRPSSLYSDKYLIPDGVHRDTFLDIMSGVITPDVNLAFKQLGLSTYTGERTRNVKGEYEIRKVRDRFDKWKENNYDKRKTCD